MAEKYWKYSCIAVNNEAEGKIFLEQFIIILEVFARAVSSVIVLFILTRLMGKKQISQLSYFDYVVGITIGSIAAQMAFDDQLAFINTLIAMVVYTLVAVLTSIVTSKSIKVRRFVVGSPIVLIYKGKILEESMRKVRYDLNDLLSECRANGYFNIGDIEYGIMESSGRMSFLIKSTKRPVNPQDMAMNPAQEDVCPNLIMDGVIMENNLKAAGKDKIWLEKELAKQNIGSARDILLAIVDETDSLTVFKKNNDSVKYNYFE